MDKFKKEKVWMTFAKLAEANPDIQFIWAGGFSFGKMTEGYAHFKKLIDNPPKT